MCRPTPSRCATPSRPCHITRPARLPGFVDGSAAELLRDDVAVGSCGRLAGGDAPFALFAAELRLDALRSSAGPVTW